MSDNTDTHLTGTGLWTNVPGSPPSADDIAAGPWYPATNLADVRQAARLATTITDGRLRPAVVNAIAHVQAELATWQAQQAADGHATLAAVPAPIIGTTSIKVALYHTAVLAIVQALLEESARDQATMPAGLSKADRVLTAEVTRESTHWRNARYAIADIIGTSRSTVRVI